MTNRHRRLIATALTALLLGAAAQTGSAAEPSALLMAITDPAPTPLAPIEAPAPVTDTLSPAPTQVECVAKVIVHEAGNQPRDGQIAVAQVIRTRVRAGRFGADACSVVHQRGQFFDVEAYHPPRNDVRWDNAVAIATSTLAGQGDDLVPGALFFHTAASPMANRVRVAQIADHVFYR